MLKDHDLSSHVLNITFAHKFLLRDRLACILMFGRALGAEVGDTELATAELFLEDEEGVDIHHWFLQNTAKFRCRS